MTTITDKAIGNQEKSLYKSIKVGPRSKRSKSRSKALLSSANDIEANAGTPLSSSGKSKKSVGLKGNANHSSGESSGNQSNSEDYDSSSSRNSERSGSFSKWKNWLFNETTRDIQSKYKKSHGVAGSNFSKSGMNEGGTKLVVIPEEKPLLGVEANTKSSKSRPSGYGSTGRSSKGNGAVHTSVRSPNIGIVKQKVESESSGEDEEDDVLDRRSLDR